MPKVGRRCNFSMLVFSGSSNQTLAKNLAKELGTRLGKIELSRFSNDEARVWINETNPGRIVVLVQSLSAPTDEHLVEFCLIGDALQRLGVKRIIAVIPWLGYSKQDKIFRPGEPLSVKVIAKMLQVIPLEKVITFDLHNLAIPGFFEVPVVNLSGRKVFREYCRKLVTDKTVIAAVDAGSVKSSERFSEDLGGVPLVYMNKVRDLVTGKVVYKSMSEPVEGKTVLIKDDLISTGNTLVEAAKFLKQNGAETIDVCATHHLYVPGAQEKLDQSPLNQIMVTDTIELKSKSKKLKVISVAKMIAEEIAA
ncbi:MAG: Ribose-phosphate pyrophosphokinase [Candidatus Beckwithbacteria bacterium GW2011_GWC2_47_9]|uniref:ribose-phosphate diphosphokinase n=2 Tax=Candidatus Beckwithiibacteriota TaxID=1752726 RepID=A0A0G1TZU4_9BACT|nr:MAG: Ribose-phosphate pyrophosphokinase [Candidatus Beckwithbacteria bacterium GW2011_GWC2_47_9]